MIRISSPDIWQGKSTQEALNLLPSMAIYGVESDDIRAGRVSVFRGVPDCDSGCALEGRGPAAPMIAASIYCDGFVIPGGAFVLVMSTICIQFR